MKIITWNCNMAFRKKAEFILKQKPDILIVPECEHPDKLIFSKTTPLPSDCIWYGTNPHKGLGVLSYSSYKFKLLEIHNPAFKTVLPIAVSGGAVDFILFAIWANNPMDKDGQYIGQIWKAIHYYESLLSSHKCILAGDFNSNTIWDKPKRVGNHSALVEKLAAHKIYSSYHHFYAQQQGKEKHATLYLYRHKNKPYHLDYCFASDYFMERLAAVKVGSYRAWTAHSDHKPLMVSFNL